MQKFISQFRMNDDLSRKMEESLNDIAGKVIKGFKAGEWRVMAIDGVPILLLPGNVSDRYTFHSQDGWYTTTDHLTASAAFTCIFTRWFWNTFASQMNEDANKAHSLYEDDLNFMVYSRDIANGIDTKDYFDITD